MHGGTLSLLACCSLLIAARQSDDEATRVNAMNIHVATPGGLPHGVLFSVCCDFRMVPACLTADVSYVVCSLWAQCLLCICFVLVMQLLRIVCIP
jgi:hypothetical protein